MISTLDKMSIEDITREWRHWDTAIQKEKLSGDQLSNYVEYRRNCATELAKRGVKIE